MQKYEKKLKSKKAKELKERIKQWEMHALGLDVKKDSKKGKRDDDTPDRKPWKGESAKWKSTK